MNKTVVVNVVGLTPKMLGVATPALSAFAERGKVATVDAVTPAVTCTSQASYFTGTYPDVHGIVANGWYFHDECEIKFWRQCNHLVTAPKLWEMARERDPSFTCANLFGWYNMYSSVDYSVTPRPMYPADGRKLPDIYTCPVNLREQLQSRLGTFPLFEFWGPMASINSSKWIAEAALEVDERFDPTLTLIYLPHLDYNLQRLGPDDPAIAKDLREVDAVCASILKHYDGRGARIIVLSEYGITSVNRPVHLNRILREQGLIAIREELGRELLDPGSSAAFAVCDHQIAHVYVNDKSKLGAVRELLESTSGVERVLDGVGKQEFHLNHQRAGDLVVISNSDSWFSYYYWLDDRRAPDFARTVDIHRKPGYDPVELFLDPAILFPKLKVGYTLLKKSLGFRYLMDVIGLNASLVKGSHGRVTDSPEMGPLVITNRADRLSEERVSAYDICRLILDHIFEA
jgi:predicted AlkP superfamily pyrophosphatase or phosphodiesterase